MYSLRNPVLFLLAFVLPVAAFAQLPPRPGGTIQPLRPFVGPISKSNPTLVVMVHGYTNDPATSGNPKPGSLEFSKHYWSFELCSRLMGAFTMTNFMQNNPPTGGLGVGQPTPTPAQIATALRSMSGKTMSRSKWDNEASRESVVGDYFYTAGEPPAGGPRLALMISGRNASTHIGPQAKELIDQVYEKVNAQYPTVKPNLVFIGHSMGGLTMRYILTPPNDTIAGVSLTARQKERAAWIRERTVYLVTLATPHEGSPLPAKFQEVRQFLRDKTSFIKPILRLMGFSNPDPVGLVTNVLGVCPALDHLRQDFCQQANAGIIAPHKMARADGTLIPVYSMGGRTPAGSFFNDPDEYPKGGMKFDDNMERDLKAVGLMMLDWALHNIPGSGNTWGSLLSISGMDLDDTRRGTSKIRIGANGLTSPPEKIGGLEGLPLFYVKDQNDGQPDADGMVAIHSALGLRLGTSTNLYLDHSRSWTVAGKTYPGSWYRIPTGPWDRTNHDTICQREAIGDWIKANILDIAGPTPSAGPVSVWP